MTARDGVKHSEMRPTGRCEECGKFAFPTRKSAKRYMQDRFKGQKMSVYKCKWTDWYHYGHTPAAVRSGDASRGEYADKRKDWM